MKYYRSVVKMETFQLSNLILDPFLEDFWWNFGGILVKYWLILWIFGQF